MKQGIQERSINLFTTRRDRPITEEIKEMGDFHDDGLLDLVCFESLGVGGMKTSMELNKIGGYMYLQ